MKRLIILVSLVAGQLAALGKEYSYDGFSYLRGVPMEVTIEGKSVQVMDYSTGLIYFGDAEYHEDGTVEAQLLEPVTMQMTRVEMEPNSDGDLDIYEY